MSLEELMEIEVALTTRTGVSLFEAPAATYVLTADDIRRSGAASLPEALRLVPGMQVARIDASKWAVSARGFGHRFANKLLVLIDGRHVYSPYFAGVFWEVVDVLLEDVERIEVVRGPGATLWGANAVNGIVNVVTRAAADTRGSYIGVSQAAGRDDRSLAARHGARIAGTDVRVHASVAGHGAFVDADGAAADDDWETRQAGVRGDWAAGDETLSLRAGVYDDRIEENLPGRSPDGASLASGQDARHRGGHLLARWDRRLSSTSGLWLKGYYDVYERDDGTSQLRSHALDLDFQHHFAATPALHLVWGLSHRQTRDEANFPIPGEGAASAVSSAFVHGEASRGPLRLDLGTKLEHNEYSGLEWQPSARLLWLPDRRQVLWAAATRAVRTPALSDFVPPFLSAGDSLAGGPDPGAPPLGGTPPGGRPGGPSGGPPRLPDLDVDTESLRSLEAGYRLRPVPAIVLDVAVFHNDYERLRLIPFVAPQLLRFASGPGDTPGGPPPGPPEGLLDLTPESARTWGGEAVTEWQLSRGRLRAAYARLVVDLRDGAPRPAGTVSEQRLTLWGSVDLTRSLAVDAILSHVDPSRPPAARADTQADIGADSSLGSALAGYTDLDLRLAWQPRPGWEIAVSGQGLLHAHRPEFTGFVFDSPTSQVPRRIVAELRWHR